VRHLVFHRAWAQEIREQLAAGKRPANAELRRALTALVEAYFGEREDEDGKPEVQGG